MTAWGSEGVPLGEGPGAAQLTSTQFWGHHLLLFTKRVKNRGGGRGGNHRGCRALSSSERPPRAGKPPCREETTGFQPIDQEQPLGTHRNVSCEHTEL